MAKTSPQVILVVLTLVDESGDERRIHATKHSLFPSLPIRLHVAQTRLLPRTKPIIKPLSSAGDPEAREQFNVVQQNLPKNEDKARAKAVEGEGASGDMFSSPVDNSIDKSMNPCRIHATQAG